MSLYSTPLTAPFASNDPAFSEELLRQIEQDKQLVDRIRRERLRAQQLKQGLEKKQSELQRISTENRELSKFKPYFQKFSQIKQMLDQALHKLEAKEIENSRLKDQLERVMCDFELTQRKIIESDKLRIGLMKERGQLQRLNREIEETFIDYKNQCKKKETSLISRLEREYRQSKEDKKVIDQLDQARRQLTLYRRRCEQLDSSKKAAQDQKNSLLELLAQKQKQVASLKQNENSNTINSKCDQEDRYQLIREIQELKRAFLDKQKELQKSRMFNHELSIQYDSSVNKNLDFERQLYEYRRQNHELKKQVGLFIQKEEYEEAYKKQAMMDGSLDEGQSIGNLSSRNL